MKEEPSTEALQRFEIACDDAAWDVLKRFEWLGLPDKGSDQFDDLATDINMAIANVMKEWL